MIGIPAIVLFEMRYGVARSDRRARSEAGLEAFLSLAVTPWSFEAEDAAHAGDIRAQLEKAGTPTATTTIPSRRKRAAAVRHW